MRKVCISGYIYVLICPIDNTIKYVGLTRNPQKRKNQHRCYSQKISKNYRYNSWKTKLKELKERPIFKIIEETTTELVGTREIFWISYYRNLKTDLFNLTLGGDYNSISKNHNSVYLKGKKLEDYYGIERANEIKSKIGLKGSDNPNFGGKNCTREWKEKQSIIQSKTKILVYENNILIGTFRNSKNAGEFLGCNSSNIRMAKSKNWLIKRKYKIIDFIK